MLEKFTVIDILKTRSNSVATINGNCLKFNVQTCYELEYPPFIQVMMNAKDKQFAIRPCKEDDPNAMSFSKPKAEQKYYVRVNFPAATALIRKATGWSSDETWNVPGVFIAEEHALIYDLGAAYIRQFEIILREAKPWAIMSSYNIVNGHRASENPDLLIGILRDEWGFDGMVTTDWWTFAEHYKEVMAGNDLKMATGFPERLMEALDRGALTREAMELAAKHILSLILELD